MDELTATLSGRNRELLVRAEEVCAQTRASIATAQYILLGRMQTVASYAGVAQRTDRRAASTWLRPSVM